MTIERDQLIRQMKASKRMRPIIVQSMPSSGSDWFFRMLQMASLTARGGQLRADPLAKEYFNPICNPRHHNRLAQVFGCETIGTYRNIWKKMPDKALEPVISDTFFRDFQQGRVNCTKECYSGNRMSAFAARFHQVTLLRGEGWTFPARRLRVLSWYEAMYTSMLADGADVDAMALDPEAIKDWPWSHDELWGGGSKVPHLYRCALTAHRAMFHRMQATAPLPPIYWENLMTYTQDALYDHLADGIGDHPSIDLEWLTVLIMKQRSTKLLHGRPSKYTALLKEGSI